MSITTEFKATYERKYINWKSKPDRGCTSNRKLINVHFFMIFFLYFFFSTESTEEAIIKLHLKGLTSYQLNTLT